MHEGRVTLSGAVGSDRERLAEAAAVRSDGVRAVANKAVVQPIEWTPARFLGLGAEYGRDGESGSVAGRVEALLECDNEVDGTTVRVLARCDSVVPTGFVRSWHERDLIERLAWRARECVVSRFSL